VKFCEPLIRRGKRLSIITNLGKHLTDEEAACLARFAVIQISLDTADAELLPKIRRKVQLSTIVGNIERIRAAVEAGSGPELSLSCGVYDKNFRGLPELCDFAIAHDVKSITFWQLVKYDDIPGALNVYPIPSLPPEEIAQAVEVMQRTIRILKAARIGVSVAGGFLDEWRKLLPSSGQPAAALAS
jgi:MoaA/NifB/PqqE/SkfB family radical SAM enzyme